MNAPIFLHTKKHDHKHLHVAVVSGSILCGSKSLEMKFVFNVLIDIGGTSASEELLDTVEVFFIVNEVWTVMVQSLPRTPASSAIVNINERMHLIGGLYGVYTQKRLRNIFIS